MVDCEEVDKKIKRRMCSTKDYKRRTDSNNSTGPNETVRVATLYCYSIYLIETKGQKNGKFLPTNPSLQPMLAGRGSDAM